MLKRIINSIYAEFQRTVLNDSINRFYVFSMILWPIVSLVQIIYNVTIFPISEIQLPQIHTEKELFYFIFIGYCSFVLYSNAVQSSWRLGSERFQGTLSQIFISPINKLLWLYARNLSLIISNSWFFIVIFILGNFIYTDFSVVSIGVLLVSILLLVIGAWLWGAFLSTLCIILRDGSIVYTILEGPQYAFSGSVVPLSISPKIVTLIGGLLPVSYSISLLRDLLIHHKITGHAIGFTVANVFVLVLTFFILHHGELYMRRTGKF